MLTALIAIDVRHAEQFSFVVVRATATESIPCYATSGNIPMMNPMLPAIYSGNDPFLQDENVAYFNYDRNAYVKMFLG